MIERFSASVAGRHMACHASANLELAIPGWVPPVEDPTIDNAANRGTQMHELFAKVLAMSNGDVKNFAEALTYVAEVRSRRRFQVLIEMPAQALWLSTKPGTTADLVLYVSDEIHVIDLKTGRIPVRATENSQMMYYGATYGHLSPKAPGVHLHIVQPWADNIDYWFASAARITQFMEDAQDAEKEIQQGDTAFMPGDHCMFCDANPRSRGLKGHPFCPALMKMYYPPRINEEEMLNDLD